MSPIPKPWPVTTGDLWSIPIAGIGHYALVIARAPTPTSPVPFSFGYLLPKPFAEPPSPKTMPPLANWQSAWIGLLPMKPFKEARWNRIGPLPSFNPADWPITPCANLRYDEEDLAKNPDWATFNFCSIETTRDEPSMTVIDSTGVTTEEALRFPQLNVITQASSFEKALAKIAKGLELRGWDLDIRFTPVDSARITRWRSWAEQARKRCLSRPDLPHPAGRATDKRIKAGDWLGMPLTGGGFSAVVVARRKKGAAIFADAIVYCFPRRFDDYPTIHQLARLTPEDSCLLCGTSLISVRDGRWRLLGEHPDFDPAEWIIPYGWHQVTSDRGTGKISVNLDGTHYRAIQVPESTLALDPHSHKVTCSSFSSSSIESDTAACERNLIPPAAEEWFEERRITPARINAWRKLNKAIEANWK